MSAKFPDFIVAGFKKCGTTSLMFNLNKHQDIYVPINKGFCNPIGETFFFAHNFNKGIDNYKKLFDVDVKICGDKCPEYINQENIIKRINQYVPDIKIILCLRNPVNRFLSHLNMNLNRKASGRIIDVNFDKAINSDEYFKRALYADKIKTLYNYFDPKNVLILINDEITKSEYIGKAHKQFSARYADVGGESLDNLNICCDFLGVDQMNITPTIEFASHGYDKVKALVNEKQIKKIFEKYQKPNQDLFDLLGYEIESWKTL